MIPWIDNVRLAEDHLIGILLHADDDDSQRPAWQYASQRLSADDIYGERNRTIWRAITTVAANGQPIDVYTVVGELVRSKEIKRAGGAQHVCELVTKVVSCAYLESTVALVHEWSQRRKIASVTSDLQASAGTGAFIDTIDASTARLKDLEVLSGGSRAENLAKFAAAYAYALVDQQEAGEQPPGCATGFLDLDRVVRLRPGNHCVLAARPAMGKSALALSMALNVARRGVRVNLVTLEMSTEQTSERLISMISGVPLASIRDLSMSSSERGRVARAANRMINLPIDEINLPGLEISALRTMARQHHATHPTDLWIVDYLQLMTASGPTVKSREQEISAISRGLKSLAKELRVPVISLAQLNRGVENRDNKRPRLADLRECVTGDTLVMLADGRRVPISDLVGQTPVVLSLGKDRKIVHARAEAVWPVGRRSVVRIKTSSGRELACTHEHRVLTGEGWATADSIREGDRVALSRFVPEPESPDEWDDLRLAFLGQMTGDGSYLKGQPMRYTTQSEANSEAVRVGAESMGCTVNRHKGRRSWWQLCISGNGNRWHPSGANKWFRDIGIFNQRSHEKRAPVGLFALSNRQIAIYLRHLWAADGSYFDRKGHSSVYLSTTSIGLARDVSALLLRFGIVARTYQIAQGKHRPSYHVSISGTDQQALFLEHVGSFGPREEDAREVLGTVATTSSNTNVDTLPICVWDDVKSAMYAHKITRRQMSELRGTKHGGSSAFKFCPSFEHLESYAMHLGDDLDNWLDRAVFWDRVVSVDPAGVEEVFDITVPGPESWLADGLVSHNSGAIEQDADVVIFLYRDEYYDPQSPDTGVAELLVAKNRQGPTCTVQVAFDEQTTKFANLHHGGAP